MELSIIIVHYNTFVLTSDCIRSVYAAEIPLSFEIILVNNSDEDRPVSDLREEFPDVVIVQPETNIGFAKGNNLGISHAKGEVILLLNSDTIVNSQSVLPVYKKLAGDATIGAITCRLLYADGTVQHNCQPFPSRRKMILEKMRLHKLMSGKRKSRYMQGFYFDYSANGNPDWIWGTYFMFRKNLLEKLPGNKLNDDYFMYMEDMQWCWDIRKAGFEISYFAASSVIHLHGGSKADKSSLMKDSRNIFRKNTGL